MVNTQILNNRSPQSSTTSSNRPTAKRGATRPKLESHHTEAALPVSQPAEESLQEPVLVPKANPIDQAQQDENSAFNNASPKSGAIPETVWLIRRGLTPTDAENFLWLIDWIACEPIGKLGQVQTEDGRWLDLDRIAESLLDQLQQPTSTLVVTGTAFQRLAAFRHTLESQVCSWQHPIDIWPTTNPSQGESDWAMAMAKHPLHVWLNDLLDSGTATNTPAFELQPFERILQPQRYCQQLLVRLNQRGQIASAAEAELERLASVWPTGSPKV